MRRGAAFAIAKHSLRCDCWAVAGERNAPNSAKAAETSRRMNPSPMTSGESLACNATRGQQRAINSASVSHPHAGPLSLPPRAELPGDGDEARGDQAADETDDGQREHQGSAGSPADRGERLGKARKPRRGLAAAE